MAWQMTAASAGLGRRHLAWLLGNAALIDATQSQAHAETTTEKLPPGFVGMNVLWGSGEEAALRDRFARARALGITELRIDWEWRIAEPAPGSYDWTAFDRLVSTAHRAGITLLPMVHYAPGWALISANKDPMGFELAPADHAFMPFARFLVACVQRYGPGGDAPVPFDPPRDWQIWNEPNNKDFWGPAPDPTRFAALMRTVAGELRPHRSRIRIVHAGLSNADEVFLSRLWDADPHFGETFDVMAVHPYIFDVTVGVRRPDEMDADIPADAGLGFVGEKAKPNYLGKVFNLQLLMRLRGDPGKPIWITEMGFLVSTARVGVSECRQAALTADTMRYITRYLTDQPFGVGTRKFAVNVERVYWFALDDFVVPDGFGNFGVYRADHSLRPSGEVLRSLLKNGGADL